ncbi:phosphatidylglycerol lysyltransferase domain-containing protein [Sphingobacterium sp. MYb382]|uniref:phosphatidylglycerol lysyltransferase domain-containing protein n=1 Tax=Sphingobacterium sp. MYb382 TaxID=2745278 RepID=UPI00309F78BF
MIPHLKANNYYFKEILGFLFLLLAIYFLRKQHGEIQQARVVLRDANLIYVGIGLLLTIAYILLQAYMYIFAFRSVHSSVTLGEATRLFLKRNLVSVFLPGGGITSLVFFSEEIERKGVSKSKIGFASYIFGVAGFASLALVAVPVIIYLALVKGASADTWTALLSISVLVGLLIIAMRSFLKRGWVYRMLYRISPQVEPLAEEISAGKFSLPKMLLTLLASIGVEVCGIAHLYIAMLALGVEPSLEVSAAGYITATLFFAISPFLRGLGAVELSLVYVLQSYGIAKVDAFSVTILYRVFEFWLPLVAGIGAFFFMRGNIILRFLPGVLLAVLGVVNIMSVLTPPLVSRLHFIERLLPLDLIHFSNIAVLLTGILLVCCAAFLIRGLRNAWWIAILLSSLSLFGNMFKGFDYEEAILAFVTLLVLLYTRSNYRIKGDIRLQTFGTRTAIYVLLAVLVYGIIGFYFLDKREFGVDFSLSASIKSTVRSFALLDPDPEPHTKFARGFISSINVLGGLSMALLVYVFIKPLVFHGKPEEEDRERALELLTKYGRSADDYFKVYPDKAYFFGESTDGFIAYKTAQGFAVALGEPVCSDDEEAINGMLKEFEAFCLNNGLKTAYYKIAEDRLSYFQELGKKAMPLGEEAIVDLSTFTLEGKDRKSLRNALNALNKKGFKTVCHPAPIKDGLLQKLKHVSDDWLQSMDRKEILFSSGMFNWEELKQQTIITVENDDEKIVGFLNIIPDYAPHEGSYDLIRKPADAPSGTMDALIIALMDELRNQDKTSLNMGLAAMAGIDRPSGFPEWTMKFAYERLRQFRHYQGLFEFKDKFNPDWQTKYLIYENHYDLASLPLVLSKIMKV